MSQTAEEITDLVRTTFTASLPSAGPFGVSDQFRDSQNHPAGIRAPHAIQAMQAAQCVDRWSVGEGASVSIALAARTDTRQYDALITATDTTAMGMQIMQAWRLYGGWPRNPTAALGAFIARFGLEVIVGGSVRGLFVPTFTGMAGEIVGLAGEPKSCTMSAMVRKDGNGPLTVEWAYAIDDEAYRRYVATNR